MSFEGMIVLNTKLYLMNVVCVPVFQMLQIRVKNHEDNTCCDNGQDEVYPGYF